MTAAILAIAFSATSIWAQNDLAAQAEANRIQQPAKSEVDPKAAQAEALKKFGEEAAKYEIRFRNDNEIFALKESSIMNWTNPARRGENGAIYLWMHKGRPEVIGSIFTYVYNDIVGDKHEFHSLATKPLEA